MRQSIVAGNWKMNGTRESAVLLASEISKLVKNANLAAEVLLCPPAIYLPLVAEVLADNGLLHLGAQNCAEHESGAYTGEVSALMIREFACQYVIIGHSERRQLFNETGQQIAAKFQQIQKQGMQPILCIGELQAQRETGKTFDVIRSQLFEVIDVVGVKALANAVVAYEPVWAIGTGLTASPSQAEEVHAHIRDMVAELNKDIATDLRIIYGGSVKPENASELFKMPDIDGGLIGGASLNTEDFMAICKALG